MNNGGTEFIAILRRQWRYLLKIGSMEPGFYMETPTQDVILSLVIGVNTLHMIIKNWLTVEMQ